VLLFSDMSRGRINSKFLVALLIAQSIVLSIVSPVDSREVLARAEINESDVRGEKAVSQSPAQVNDQSAGPESSQSSTQTEAPEVSKVRERLLSLLKAAEAKGVGISAYRSALDQLVEQLKTGDNAEQAKMQIRSIEQNLTDQISKATDAATGKGIASSGIQYGNLIVYANEPNSRTILYDARNRPAGVPVPAEFEGLTKWNINPKVKVHWNDQSQVVASAEVIMSCEITTWLPTGCSKKLKQHEGGHSLICLALYKKGHLVAREMAQQTLMNRPWNGGQAANDFQSSFKKEVSDVINWLNKEYDRITDHGRNNLDSSAAVTQAFRNCTKSYRLYLSER